MARENHSWLAADSNSTQPTRKQQGRLGQRRGMFIIKEQNSIELLRRESIIVLGEKTLGHKMTSV